MALCSVAAVAVLTGCTTFEREQAPLPYSGDPLKDGETAISQGPPRDRVLWEYRTAAVALRRGQFDEAKRLLDDAILSIGGIAANDPNAKKARSYFSGESSKTFHGEPYERVMAYFYRGILYWMDGEPDNARACFRSAQLEDSDTENKQYAADYVLLDYLDGLASVKLAGDGSDAFKRAQALAKNPLPPYDPKANALIFIEFGNGPLKFATGQYAEELRFQPGPPGAASAVVRVDGEPVPPEPFDDLYFQATTRGGRVMDHILANKAVFKTGADVVGNVGLIGGAIMAAEGRGDVRNAGIGLAAAGLISKIVSAATVPAADIRCWDNLPQYLSCAALRLTPGQHTVTVEFRDSAGSPMGSLTKTVTLNIADGTKDTVVFVSDKNQ